MADKNIEITLTDPEETVETIENNLEINADDNQGKTSFYDSDTVKIRFYTSSNSSYSVHSSIGTARKSYRNIRFSYTEDIVFTDALSASLTYKPSNVISTQWLGKSLGSADIQGNTITLKSKGSGILRITYYASYDLIEFSIPRVYSDTNALVYADQQGTVASININITPRYSVTNPENQSADDTQSESEPVQYTLTVLDYTTNEPVPGAAVYLNGVCIGQTAADGSIYLGKLLSGAYTLFMSKAGYFNSNEDGLNNDSFTVS